MELRGKTALVTGSGRRGGRAIALELGRRGINVAVHYQTSRRGANEVVGRLQKMGVQSQAFRADLSKWAAVRKLAQQVRRRFGRINILVNNAANFHRTPFGKIREKEWDRTLNTNLKGPFLLCQELGLPMKRRGSGVIINIADWAVSRPYPSYLPYCISKGGIVTMTKGLRKILGPAVRIHLISPKLLKRFSGYAREVVRLLG